MKKNLITGFLIATPLVGLWLFLGVKDEQNQNDKKSPKASSSGIYRTNSSERGNIQRFNSHVKEIESGEFVLAERYSIWAGDLPILLEGMTVEELLDAGKRAAKFKNQRIKTLFSTEIVAELARRDNFEEALSLVPLHRSVFRDQLMRYLFGHWKTETPQFLSHFEKLDEHDKKIAFSNFALSRFSSPSGIDGLTKILTNVDNDKSIQVAVRSCFHRAIMMSREGGDLVALGETKDLIEEMHNEGLLDSENVLAIIRNFGSEDSIESISKFLNSPKIEEEASFQETLDLLATRAISTGDPEKIVVELSEMDKKGGSHDLFRSGIRNWLVHDPEGATLWVKSNQTMGALVNDVAISEVANFAASEAEFEGAREWVEEIANPELQELAKSEIWNRERDYIEKQTQADPQGTIDSLISGESVHEEYWIKESFDKWVSTSPDQAAIWYEENRGNLSRSQNQHVARSYAEQAIKSGEWDTANEWVKHVTDNGYRNSLQEQIEKASSGQ